MIGRTLRLAGAIVAIVSFLTIVGGARAALPSAVEALGDSLTRGYGAGGVAQDYPGESWSTGTDPAVGSHYLRLLAAGAPSAGKTFNDALSGSKMGATTAQAQSAV